jgi:predicted O-methyltransferase YrrM
MEQLHKFYNEINKLPTKMGSIVPPQQQFLINYLRDNPNIKQVLETGFHKGLSAAVMMTAREDIEVSSVDILWFDYTRRAKLLLDIYYPQRHLLLAGNSVNSLPVFFKRFPHYKPDLVFIDGGHERPVPFIDLYFILKNISEGTHIIIDDYCKEHGEGGVIEAVDEFLLKGYIVNPRVFSAEDRGWIIGKRSDKLMEDSPMVSKENLQILCEDVQSHYPD